jgi:hypothetical protein
MREEKEIRKVQRLLDKIFFLDLGDKYAQGLSYALCWVLGEDIEALEYLSKLKEDNEANRWTGLRRLRNDRR